MRTNARRGRGAESEEAKYRVVKVQLSLSTSEPTRQVLIYDEGGGWQWQGTAAPDILRLMNGRVKAYFFATQLRDGRLSIEHDAKTQEW